ncbi:TPA: hypothetical protein N0F65_009483 [Lagenidium giganteum]|uniref:DDE Tnp4 domain-containing protein n=1 Tax=Lagenidium giganteum TaxID=4803 RepID=A0AAV2ZHE2_9STRA|nr:TPA: hypothetical protein N0F65_009483 [Lagenidium giganteum]
MFFRRLAYPNRLADLERLFGRSQAALSVITNAVLTHIYDRWHHLLRLDRHRLTEENCLQFASAIQRKGAPLNCCIGFIDGTLRHPGNSDSHTTVTRDIYGDPASSRNDCIICPLQGSTLNDDQQTFNKRMSKVRVSVEWGFEDVVRHWAFTDFVKKQKRH